LKLALGTVQFGIAYGINNSVGLPSKIEVEKILALAHKKHIDLLDTARVYGTSEESIGNFKNFDFKIVTKFSKVGDSEALVSQLNDSLINLNLSSVYGYLAHNADELIEKPELWDGLLKVKAANLVKKIGFSLYSTSQLEKLLEMEFIPDLLQLPYSLLDRKFESYFARLKEYGSEIHVRSVFLQGLYLMDIEKLPLKLIPIKEELRQLHSCCKDFDIPMSALALNFVTQNPYVDRVIIGVDSEQHLQQNLIFSNTFTIPAELFEIISKINVREKELLNPANW
jgi:aryl-alcohol dehydrogenase-like predicted oxidoreductase